MIPSDWKRMGGIHTEDDGLLAAVWFAIDRQADVIHLYDCCKFNREVLVVIAEGVNARGRWVPVAWERKQKAMADELLDRGVNIISEPYEDSDGIAEVVSRGIEERMRTGRFRVEKRLAEWLDEFKGFTRQDQRVPREGYPLMSATRYAVAMADEWARPERMPGASKPSYPDFVAV